MRVSNFTCAMFGSLDILIDNNGELWFGGKQLCELLGYGTAGSNLSSTLARHCPNRQPLNSVFNHTFSLPAGFRQNSVIVTESDMYRLIMGSSMPLAEDFRTWVCEEVLPALRAGETLDMGEVVNAATQVANFSHFHCAEFGDLNVVTDSEGRPWFIGREVAEKLGYSTDRTGLSGAMSRHCPDRRSFETLVESTNIPENVSVRQNSVMISEPDLYRMVMSSRASGAERFRNWVCEEVLPSIRVHGGYHVGQAPMAEQYENPELLRVMSEGFASMGRAIEALTANMTAIISRVDSLEETTRTPTAAAEVVVPTGYKTASKLWGECKIALGTNCLNKNAYERMLEAVSWPTATFNIRNREGQVVPVVHYAPYHEYQGQSHSVRSLMENVVRSSVPESEHFRSHRLIGRYKI